MAFGKLSVQIHHPETGVTVWFVVDAGGEQIAQFDSRGGWTEKDAQSFVDTENNRDADNVGADERNLVR